MWARLASPVRDLGGVWALAAVWSAAAAAVLTPQGVVIDSASLWHAASVIAACLAIGVMFAGAAVFVPGMLLPRISGLFGGVAAATALCRAGAVLSYAAGTSRAPFRDAWFEHPELAVGFDWARVTAALHGLPHGAVVLDWLYASSQRQFALLVFALAWWSVPRALVPFLRALAVALLVTFAGAALVPAIGHLPHAAHVPDLLALRAGTFRRLDVAATQGLIAFPSMHAAMSVLIPWALRHARGRWRTAWWGALALNAAVLVATVTEGGHYLGDVVAGVGVALGAGWLASRSTWASERRDARRHVGEAEVHGSDVGQNAGQGALAGRDPAFAP